MAMPQWSGCLSLVDLSKVKIEPKSREKKDSAQTLICRVMPFFPELSPNQPNKPGGHCQKLNFKEGQENFKDVRDGTARHEHSEQTQLLDRF